MIVRVYTYTFNLLFIEMKSNSVIMTKQSLIIHQAPVNQTPAMRFMNNFLTFHYMLRDKGSNEGLFLRMLNM